MAGKGSAGKGSPGEGEGAAASSPAAGRGLVVVARIGAPHGVRGEMRVKTFTAEPENIAAYGPLHAHNGRSFVVESLRRLPASPDMVVARLRGIADRDQAAALTNLELGVPREKLPPPEDEDEFYQADLVGLAAVGPDGEAIGRVAAFVDFGAGALLEIAPPQGATFYVAFTKENVPVVDIIGGKVTVVLPPEVGEKEPE